jgi:hypothetical protein
MRNYGYLLLHACTSVKFFNFWDTVNRDHETCSFNYYDPTTPEACDPGG